MAISKVVYGNKVLIDLTADTVDDNHLLSGFTAHGKDGEPVVGKCTFDSDTTDATASPTEILDTKTAYVNGVKVTGAMPNRGSISDTISDRSDVITIQSGYHDGSGTVEIDSIEKAKIIAGNIKSGVSILGVTGTYSGEGGKGQAKTATPYTDKAQTIVPDSGYDYLTQVTVDKIAYTETLNSAGGKTVQIGTVSPV